MYNSIRKASVCFMQSYGHTPSRVLLSKNQYLALVNEMYGFQQEFLIKNNSVMGLKVSISKMLMISLCWYQNVNFWSLISFKEELL